MSDVLTFGGAVIVLIGCYLITPPMALVALGLMLMMVGLARLRGIIHGAD